MTTVQENKMPAAGGPHRSGSAAYLDGVLGVVGLEMRQRLRSRGWYIMLGLWFVIIGIVTALTWWSWLNNRRSSEMWNPGQEAGAPGALIFEIVLLFVLLFGLLVAPALSANAVNGDRAGGTLAIMQVTLLSSGQILWGKFLASWLAGLGFLVASLPFLVFAIVQGGLGLPQIGVALLVLAVELGIVCALGVGISTLANRPLFSIVVTFLVVAALVFGTFIAFILGAMVTEGTVRANQVGYQNMYYEDPGTGQGQGGTSSPVPSDVTDQDGSRYCYGALRDQTAVRTDRVAWMLAMNPFVVVADAIPYGKTPGSQEAPEGIFEIISQGSRYAQAGPEASVPCANGRLTVGYVGQETPLWPSGLGLQLLVTAGILVLGWRALRTPAVKLAKGTRVA